MMRRWPDEFGRAAHLLGRCGDRRKLRNLTNFKVAAFLLSQILLDF